MNDCLVLSVSLKTVTCVDFLGADFLVVFYLVHMLILHVAGNFIFAFFAGSLSSAAFVSPKEIKSFDI